MKLKALSYYRGDKNTKFGDCILIYNMTSLIVYDCGHEKHKDEIKTFLQDKPLISVIHIVVSHDHLDHTSGICDLLDWLSEQGNYTVRVYSHQYLKHVDVILDKIDDGRRTRESLKKALLGEFDNIKNIIETAQAHNFSTTEALKGTSVGSCTIVGPTVDEFIDVAAQAVDNRASDTIGEGLEEESVMNAASVQLKCTLDNAETIILTGDATPAYLHNLDAYNIIQFPHHGQLDDGKAILNDMKEPDYKTFFISDNTGSAAKSGGSDDLVKYMVEKKYAPALNTKNGVIMIPIAGAGSVSPNKSQGVKLGGMDN